MIKGETKVLLDKDEVIIPQDEAYLVKGTIPHSVWSNQEEETIMIGISVMPDAVFLAGLILILRKRTYTTVSDK